MKLVPVILFLSLLLAACGGGTQHPGDICEEPHDAGGDGDPGDFGADDGGADDAGDPGDPGDGDALLFPSGPRG